MTEVWKDIPGYEGRYQVSDLGRVRSVDRWARAAFELTGDRKRGADISRHMRGERPRALGRTWSFA